MSAVNNLLAASKPYPAQIAADRQIDKQTRQAETKSRAGTGLRDETSSVKHVGKTTTQSVNIDAETQTVIFQTIDENTDSVVSQYPSEAQLRLKLSLKAYLEAAQAK